MATRTREQIRDLRDGVAAQLGRDSTPPTNTPIDLNRPSDLLNELRVMFPWLDAMGLDARWLQNLVATSASADEMVVKLRQEPAYRKRFPGLWRQDGSMRMTEAEYLRTEDSYRQLFRQYGFSDEAFREPAALQGLFDGEVDPNELGQRLDVYARVRDGSQSVRDAFYAYAGIDLSVDDLFEAVVDEEAGARLRDEYNVRVSAGFDYPTFMQRVTDLAHRHAADMVSRSGGVLTIRDVNKDPELTKRILDLIYTEGSGATPSSPLSLQELLSSYEEALIGAAASGAGLGLPSKERIAQILAAGVERARAQQSYLEFGMRGGPLSGANQRQGGAGIGRSDLEDAAFFGSVDAARRIELARAAEEAAGQSGGTFRFNQGRDGRFIQQGLDS